MNQHKPKPPVPNLTDVSHSGPAKPEPANARIRPSLRDLTFDPDMTEEAQSYAPAENGPRFLASFIDSTISVVATGLILALLGKGKDNVALSYLIMFTYYIIPTYLSGATPGKYFMGLRVFAYSENGSRKAGLFQVILRETVGKITSTVLMFMGFIIILFRSDRRGLHDLICKTEVVTYK